MKHFKPVSCILSLQHFAENAASDNTQTADTDTADTKATQDSESDKQPSFDTVLQNKEYQAEFDRRVSKALETAKVKWEADTQKRIEVEKKKAEMTDEQKKSYERQQQEQQLTARENNLKIFRSDL